MNVSRTGISLALLLAAGHAYGHDCTATWDANPAEENLWWYTLYAAPIDETAEISSVIDPGTYQRSCHSMGVAEGKNYWLTLTATNSAGESDRSNPVLLDLGENPENANKVFLLLGGV